MKNHYLQSYKAIQLSTTPTPKHTSYQSTTARLQLSTPSPLYSYQNHQNAPTGYDSSTESPYRLSITTPATRQHLTETSQIQAPTIATYHPNHHKDPYDLYKVKKLNSVPKYKTTVLNRVPVEVEPQYVVSPPQTLAPVDLGFNSTSISLILKKLQDSNHLPQTITPDNIDNSIRTLVKILNNLKKSQKVADTPSQHYHEEDEDYEDDGSKTNGGKIIICIRKYILNMNVN